jgi:hypothetical protein
LEIIGSYTYNVGEVVSVEITADSWTEDASWGVSAYSISGYSNDDGWLVAQGDEDNGFNPGKWERFEWTHFQGDLYFCQQVMGAETEEDARAGGVSADETAPDEGGCGIPENDFPWTKLDPGAFDPDGGVGDGGA